MTLKEKSLKRDFETGALDPEDAEDIIAKLDDLKKALKEGKKLK